MRKLVFATVVLTISMSNIWLEWGDAYLVCSLAIAAGFAIDAAYVIAYQRHAERLKRFLSS